MDTRRSPGGVVGRRRSTPAEYVIDDPVAEPGRRRERERGDQGGRAPPRACRPRMRTRRTTSSGRPHRPCSRSAADAHPRVAPHRNTAARARSTRDTEGRTAAERETDEELQREEGDEPRPAGDDGYERERADDDLLKRGARESMTSRSRYVREPLGPSLHFGKYYRVARFAPSRRGRRAALRAAGPSDVRTYSTCGGRASRTSRRRTPAASSSASR